MFKTGGPSEPGALSLNTDLLVKFEVGKVFPDLSSDYSIDFDHSGNFCLTSSADETLRLYDVRLGK
jgi:WD40 repeat protein